MVRNFLSIEYRMSFFFSSVRRIPTTMYDGSTDLSSVCLSFVPVKSLDEKDCHEMPPTMMQAAGTLIT